MFAPFRRKAAPVRSDPESEARPIEAAPPPVADPPLAAGTVDALEADILKAIGAVTQAIGSANGEVSGARSDLDRIRATMGELAAAGSGAARQTVALAAATGQLAAVSGEIAQAMDGADAKVGEAAACARDASALISELSRAAEEIVGIVDTISAVTRQTNLLALNATIEAARAGAAGRGFAVVASEVKALSVETGKAASDIRARIERLRGSAGSSVAAVERVAAVIHGIEPVFDTVRTAVREQGASIADLAGRAEEASAFVGEVSDRAGRVDAAAADAVERIGQADGTSSAARSLANALGQRFVAVMRQTEIGDRRRLDRFPVELRVGLRWSGREARARTIDVSRGGVLLASDGPPAPVGALLDLDIERIGPVTASVVAASPMGLHCAFGRLDGSGQDRIDRLVTEIESEYRPLIQVAQAAARRIEQALEGSVAEGRLTREALFDTDYSAVSGTNPQQFETSYLSLFEDLLPPIQEPLLSDDRMVFCLAIDRNGYIPVHNRRYAQPQRPDDPAWNMANSRNRRVFDDRAGITAARSIRPFLVQSYARDMGGGVTVLMREVDTPIRLFGRHWGGFRTAYRF